MVGFVEREREREGLLGVDVGCVLRAFVIGVQVCI